MSPCRVALVQLNSRSDCSANLQQSISLCEQACDQNVDLIVLPEVFNYRSSQASISNHSEALDGPSISCMQSFAKDNQVALLIGSFTEALTGQDKVSNTSVFINEQGEIQGVYRKLHLFDVDFEAVSIQESWSFLPGDSPTIIDWKGLKIGLSICYDLRFPELYRYYALNGCQILCVPSSFTKPTGEAHWEVLLRARAIENQCFVLAPNQVGAGARGVDTYGNSCAVDPWGAVLGRGSLDQEELVVVDLDLEKQAALRQSMPVLSHVREGLFFN